MAIVTIQPPLEFSARGVLRQLARCHRPEAQADAVSAGRRDTLANREGMRSQGGENFVPRLAAVNVRAIAEVAAVIQFHGETPALCLDGACAGSFLTRWKIVPAVFRRYCSSVRVAVTSGGNGASVRRWSAISR